MKREIKFRAWDMANKKMLYAPATFQIAIYNPGGNCIGIPIGINNGDTVGASQEFQLSQSTGLCDKNNKEIFEGDIIKHNLNGYGLKPSSHLYVVSYYMDGFKTTSVNKNLWKKDFAGNPIAPSPKRENYKEWRNFEVIGNIYENPELLK